MLTHTGVFFALAAVFAAVDSRYIEIQRGGLLELHNKVVPEYDVPANGYGVLAITAPKRELPTPSTQSKSIKVKKSRIYDPYELIENKFEEYADYVHLPKRLWPKYWFSGVDKRESEKLSEFVDMCYARMYIRPNRFGPEDLIVTVFKREVMVEAIRKVIDGDSHFFDTFEQKLIIPVGCEEDEIEAKHFWELNGGGVLVISAPKHEERTPSTHRIVSISTETPISGAITTKKIKEVVVESTQQPPLEQPDFVETTTTTHLELKTTTNTMEENGEIKKD